MINYGALGSKLHVLASASGFGCLDRDPKLRADCARILPRRYVRNRIGWSGASTERHVARATKPRKKILQSSRPVQNIS